MTDDFRNVRAKLPDEVFAQVEELKVEPTDPVDESTRNGIVSLPDDVSLLTADHHGKALKHDYEA